MRNIIPPLTAKEYEELEISILEEGCREPISTWNGLIIDGHNRHDICMKHKIEFKIEEREFKNKNAALDWMITKQIGRRNLTPQQRIDLVKKRYEIRGEPDKVSLMKPMAEEAGVSTGTLHKHNVIEEKGSRRTKKDMKDGKISISNAYEKTTGTKNNPKKEPETPPKEKPKPKPKTPTPEGERYPIESRAGQPIINLSYRDHKEKIGYYAIVTFTDEKAEVEERTTAYHEVTLDSCLWRCDKCPRSVSSEQGLSDLKREGKCPGCGVPISAEE